MHPLTENFEGASFSNRKFSRASIFLIQKTCPTLSNNTALKHLLAQANENKFQGDNDEIPFYSDSEETQTSMNPEEMEERFAGSGPAPSSKKIKKEKTQKQETTRVAQRLSWKQDEDRQLLELFGQHGPKWCKLAFLLGNRKPKQVRDRYMNVLRPGINQRPWTKEEDNLLIPLFKKFGKRWCHIAALIPGRTENQVKNRYYTHLSKGVLKDHELLASHLMISSNVQGIEGNNGRTSSNEKCYTETINFVKSLTTCQVSDLVSNICNLFEKDVQERASGVLQNKNPDPIHLPNFRAIPSPKNLYFREQGVDQFFQSPSEEQTSPESADPFDNMTYEEIILIKSKANLSLP